MNREKSYAFVKEFAELVMKHCGPRADACVIVSDPNDGEMTLDTTMGPGETAELFKTCADHILANAPDGSIDVKPKKAS